MASITAISRCSGLNHIRMTINTSVGDRQVTIEQSELTLPAPLSNEEYQTFRLALLVREARAAGNTTYAQIRTYLLNRSFVE